MQGSLESNILTFILDICLFRTHALQPAAFRCLIYLFFYPLLKVSACLCGQIVPAPRVQEIGALKSGIPIRLGSRPDDLNLLGTRKERGSLLEALT